MNINFNTPNVVIVAFPRYAGGKFITNCLSLSRHAVPQDGELARYLLKNPNDYQYRFDCVMDTLPPKHRMTDWARGYELGDDRLYGPVWLQWVDGNADVANINQITQDLSNSELKFFVVCHYGGLGIQGQLQVWPNATIIKLINHEKFSVIAKQLKLTNSNIDIFAGNYTREKYEILAGPDWPSWKEFESVGHDIQRMSNQLPKEIVDEIGNFYPSITNNLVVFDMDNSIFDRNKFLSSISQLYNQLGFDDFNPELVGKFWQAYINLHVDNVQNL